MPARVTTSRSAPPRQARGESRPIRTVTRGPFFGGVEYSRPADELPDDTLREAKNIRIGNAGQAEKRTGSAPINSSALNSGATVTACGNMRFSASSEKTFAIAGDKFYEDVDGTPTDRTNGETITAGDDNTWALTNANGTLIGHNAVPGDVLMKWAASGNIAALNVDARFTWAHHVEWWDRRAWWANLSSGVNILWRSDTDDIETYGATAFLTYDDDITGIKRWINNLAVHTANSISLLTPTGSASTPYRRTYVIQSDDQNPGEGGTVGGRALVNVPFIGQCFPRTDGIYAFTGEQRLEKISDKLDGARFWDTVNTARLSESFVQVYPNRSEVLWWLPVGPSQTKMNQAIVLNWKHSVRRGEPVWYGPFEGVERNCAGFIGNKPHFGGFDGYVYDHDTGNADNDGTSDSGIDAVGETSSRAPFGDMVNCDWEHTRVMYEVLGDQGLTLQPISPDAAVPSSVIPMGGSYDSIGVDFGPGSAIPGESETSYDEVQLSGHSPFMRTRFRNSGANEPFTVRRIVSSFRVNGPIPRDTAGAN